MANIKPPKYLVITSDTNMMVAWKQWLQQFNWYATATELMKKTPEIQVATFMSVIGPDALTIFNTFSLENEEDKNIEAVKKKFQEYFVPKTNVTYERYVFNKLVQKDNETFDDFLTSALNMCKNCEFGTIEDSLLRDKIVIGVYSDKLRERLLEDDNLTLEKAINIGRAHEQTKNHMMNMKTGEQVDSIKPKRKQKPITATTTAVQAETFKCKRCNTVHGKQSCPAYNKNCKKCGYKGHFAVACKSKMKKKINSVSTAEESENNESVLIAMVNTKPNEDWTEVITLPNNKKVRFKLDTGAQCNIVTKQIAEEAKLKICVSDTIKLESYTFHQQAVLGETYATVKTKKGKQAKIKFLVVEPSWYKAIIGADTCVKLGFIQRINNVSCYENTDLFEGIGCLKNFQYDIDLVDNAEFPIRPARRIPYSLRNLVKQELDEMEKNGIIKPVTEPTPAVSPMVVVRSKGKIRICLDPSDINKNLRRRHYPLNTVEEIVSRLNGSNWFTILDCKKGFWQLKVTDRTSKYLTFATPWGRYSCLRMPFGLASAPEVFQQIMCHLLKDVDGVECAMDDILIHAKDKTKLENVTAKVRKILVNAGLTLNPEKCIFEKNSVKFLGHWITDQGMLPDPEKVEAINRLNTPQNVKELQRFLGFVTYLAKFIPNLAELSAPLRVLLQKDNEWMWEQSQIDAFNKIRDVIKNPPVLRYYDSKLPVTVSVDASSKSVGAVLLQKDQPIAYAAKALTPSQQNYSQLEKEAYAMLFGCKKFHEYVWGNKSLTIETDHKPLESIAKKTLYEAPPRLQRILFEVKPYNPMIKYVKGKELFIADTLSRDCELDAESDVHPNIEIHLVIPMTKDKKDELIRLTEADEELLSLKQYILQGWPAERKVVPDEIKKYWTFRDELMVHDGIICKGHRIIIPPTMQKLVVKCLHEGHKSYQSMLRLARDYVYWPNIAQDLLQYSSNCKVCQRTGKDKPQEEIVVQEIPQRPWSIVGTDLFELKNEHYIIIADSYSGYYDFLRLTGTSSAAIIKALKSWFSVHGIPDVLLSDNGPQYSSKEFRDFTKNWSFQHQTSSPLHARSNGLIERYVQEAKLLLKRTIMDKSDLQLALLIARNTPRENLGSPVQRLMGRRTKSTIPVLEKSLVPQTVTEIPTKLKEIREKSKHFADQGKTKPVPFEVGQDILYRRDRRYWKEGKVVSVEGDRSYKIATEQGQKYRRNSWYLKNRTNELDEEKIGETSKEADLQSTESLKTPEVTAQTPNKDNEETEVKMNPSQRTTRSGRVITTPKRLNL